jgi:hypothetical protein
LREASPAVSSLAAEAWPARDVAKIEELSRITGLYPVKVGTTPGRPGSVQKFSAVEARDQSVDLKVTYSRVHGLGLLRMVRPESASAGAVRRFEEMEADAAGFLPNARFLTSRVLDDVRTQVFLDRQRMLLEASERLQMEAVQRGGVMDEGRGPDLALVQHGMAVQLPGVVDRVPRGVVVHLHSIAPNPFEPRVMDAFRRRGWAVVTLNTSTGIRPAYSPEQEARYRELEGRRTDLVVGHIQKTTDVVKGWSTGPTQAVRFPPPAAERREFARLTKELDRLAKVVRYYADTDADIESVGRTIAKETDEALASNAYAVEAVLDYLNTQRPDIAPRAHNIPVVVVGMSAGALAAPAAVARVRDQIDAVVLVGGGADLFRISQESTLTNGGIDIYRGTRRAPKAVREQIDEVYLRTSRLDPYHTAPLLAGLPVLQVHAAWDGWVPEQTGELLSQRLGHPDRLVFQGGHSLLFFFLPGQAGRILDWIEGATLAGEDRAGGQ